MAHFVQQPQHHLLTVSMLSGVRQDLSVVLIYSALVGSDAEHIFMYFLATYTSFLEVSSCLIFLYAL